REEQLERALLALLGPETHRDRGDKEEVHPGVEVEEGAEIGLAPLEEVAQLEREDPRDEEEDHDKDVSDTCDEVAGELALERRERIREWSAGAPVRGGRGGRGWGGERGRTDGGHWAPPTVMVISRKTSSRRPDSTAIDSTSQPLDFATRPTSWAM